MRSRKKLTSTAKPANPPIDGLLLQRTTRRLALTPEGETYHPRGRDILAAIENAEAEVARAGTTPRGRLRVPDDVRVENSYIVMPELRGIGFEGKSDLIKVMRELAE